MFEENQRASTAVIMLADPVNTDVTVTELADRLSTGRSQPQVVDIRDVPGAQSSKQSSKQSRIANPNLGLLAVQLAYRLSARRGRRIWFAINWPRTK